MLDDHGQIVELTDEAAIVRVLEQDRRWAAYPLCDLEPPHRAHARYIGRLHDGRPDALVLAYAPPGFTALVPCGSAAGIAAILAHAPDLPADVTFLVRRRDLAALEMRYRVEKRWTMLRFVVTAATLRPVAARDDVLRRLTDADLPAVLALYALWPETVFNLLMFETGVYYGAFGDGVLVAIAGTHAVSLRHGSAVIGNVFTHPNHRGAGLAAATTGAVARSLIEAGAREVALNVHEENAPAIAAYRRAGFALHEPFWEGQATINTE